MPLWALELELMTPKNNVQDEKIKEDERRICWLEEHFTTMNSELGSVKESMKAIEADVSWLKQFFWIVAISSIGALIGAIINLVLK